MWAVFLMCIMTVVCGHEPEYPDINDMFPSFKDPEPGKYKDHPGATARNATIDIEKLDFIKFRKKMAVDLKNKMEVEDQGLKETKKDGRRARIRFWNGYHKEFDIASEHVTKQKAIDLMLQLIYMSRQKIQQIESSMTRTHASAEYRVGYLYDRMKDIVEKMTNLLSYMHKACKNFKKADNKDVDVHISLHSKIVRLHVDFTYYYWVLINLDEAYRENNTKLRPKLLEKDKKTGGISEEIISDKFRDWSIHP